MDADIQEFPTIIEMKVFDKGYVLRVDNVSTYFDAFENLAKYVYPSIRKQLSSEDPCVGSC